MACNWLATPEQCLTGEVAERVASGQSTSYWDALDAWLAEGVASVVRLVAAGWTEIPSPTLAGDSGALPFIAVYIRPVTYVVLTLSIIGVGVRLAWDQRGEDARDLAWALIRYVLLTGLGATVVQALTIAGDEYSTWILNATTQGVAGESLGERMAFLLMTPLGGPFDGGIKAFMSLLLIGSGLVQVAMIYARVILLAVFTALLGGAAGAALTRVGKQMLDRYVAWLVAWVLFKPAAATVYATSFALIGAGDDATSVVAGVAGLVLTPFALPAMIRLLVPATAALSGGGGGGGAAALGTGAAMVGAARSLGSGPATAGGGDPGAMRVRDATDGGPSGARLALPGGGQNSAGKTVATKTAGAGAAGGPAGAAAGAAATVATTAVKTASAAANQAVGDGRDSGEGTGQ